jgi:RNA polymerase sigma-70 factor (ECF subfamily)
MSGTNDISAQLEAYRSYLGLLARLQINRALQGKVDVSGVVQQTLFEAHQRLQQKQLFGEGQLPALLRQLLANNLVDEARKAYAGKRDARRERSLEQELEASSARLAALLAVQESGVSERLDRQENLVRLANTLTALPEAQRQAVEMHYLQGLTLAQVAEQMSRSKPSIVGLLQRGLAALRVNFGKQQESQP